MQHKKASVLEIYKGVKVRACNIVVIKLGVSQYKKILDEVERTGLSIHKVLALSSKPCERCKGVGVVFFDKEGNQKDVKRGILTIPENNGINILQQAKNTANKNQG